MPYNPDTELLHKYRIEALIGAGAFGEVYRALHLQLKASRALKVLRRDAPGVGSSDFQRCRERFELEAQLGTQMEGHANIIQAYDFEQDDEALILITEYVTGGSLADRLERAREAHSPLPVEAVLRMGQEIAEGLAALHALDAVHRDLKPSNILFDAQGRAKLADFGLAQMPGGPSLRSQLSRPEPHPGTPAYMSPEQRETTDYLTPASDSYAMGCVLFEARPGAAVSQSAPRDAPADAARGGPGVAGCCGDVLPGERSRGAALGRRGAARAAAQRRRRRERPEDNAKQKQQRASNAISSFQYPVTS